MSTLKFRALYKPTNEYADIDSIDFVNKIVVLKSYPLVRSFGLDKVDFDDVVIEQYTGLTDKNKKEIYEGDIVLLDGVERTVFLDSISTGAFRVTTPDLRDDCEWHPRMFLYWYYEIAMPKIKVIGNIHDNPELLKGRRKIK